MTLAITMLLALLGIALVLFWFEWVPADVVALGLMVAMILLGLLPKERAFAGFGSDTVMMILGLLILSVALQRTGVVDAAGRAILRHTGTQPTRLLFVIMLGSALLGAFMSNTASTAFFLPVVFGIAKRSGISPSKLLLPLAFSSILTSSVTLISTSTNLVVSGLMERFGLAPMGMFELAPVGIPIAIAGIFYMMTLGRRLLPERLKSAASTPADDFRLSRYLAEIRVPPGSPLAGKTLAESALSDTFDVTALRLTRDAADGTREVIIPEPPTRLQAGDTLIVETRTEDLLRLKSSAGASLEVCGAASAADLLESSGGDSVLVEAILLPGSPLIGRTLDGYRLREGTGLQVLGLSRHGEIAHRGLGGTILKLGDLLLIEGARSRIAALQEQRTLRVLGGPDPGAVPRTRHAPVAVVAFAGALALATFQIVPLAVAVLLGVLVVFVTRCITPTEAYREVEWKAVILIGCMLGFGEAMQHTGTAKYLAGWIERAAGDANPLWLLSGVFFLTVFLTQPMSNQAAAAVVLPVAVQMAFDLGLNPRTFAMMVAVAASCSYLTPLEPSCLLVHGPGGYRVSDFLRVGAFLTLLIFIIAILLVPLVWPLHSGAM